MRLIVSYFKMTEPLNSMTEAALLLWSFWREFKSTFHSLSLVWFHQVKLMFKDVSHSVARLCFIYCCAFHTKDRVNMFYEFYQWCYSCGPTHMFSQMLARQWVALRLSACFSTARSSPGHIFNFRSGHGSWWRYRLYDCLWHQRRH